MFSVCGVRCLLLVFWCYGFLVKVLCQESGLITVSLLTTPVHVYMRVLVCMCDFACASKQFKKSKLR